MKKTKLLVMLGGIVLLGAALTSCNNGNVAGGNSATGTVDMEKVMQSKAVTNLEKSMQAANKGGQKAIQAAYLSMQKAQQAAKKAKGKEKTALAAKAKTAQAQFSQLLQKEQTAARAQQQVMLQKVKAAVATTAKQMKLKTVLLKQAVMYHAGGTDKDISNAVIKQLEKQS